MSNYHHPQEDYFRKVLDAPPPTVTPHGTEDEVSERLKPATPTNWRMEGPGMLVADTELGRIVNFVSTDLICTGTDSNGLPTFKKIGS